MNLKCQVCSIFLNTYIVQKKKVEHATSVFDNQDRVSQTSRTWEFDEFNCVVEFRKSNMLDQPVETIVVDSVENLKDFGISSDRLIKQSGTLHRRDLSNYICNSGRLEPGNIAVFSQKGDLLCNNIVHCTFPAYDGTVKSNLRCWKSMRKVIRKLLSYVVDNDICKSR